MKGIVLARVSLARQEKEGLSLKDIQLPTIRDYAKQHDIEIVKEFVFQETASDKIRKKFNEMLDYVKENEEIKAVIAYRVDRITRNFRDAVELDNLRTMYDKEIHFANDRLILKRKSFGKDITDWDTKVYIAKQHINRLQEDAYVTAHRKLTNHEWPGGAPIGYKNAKNSENKSWIFPNEPEASIVKKIFELYSTGAYSMLEISHRIGKDFGRKIYKSLTEKILKNKFYIGTMTYDGKEYMHHYERLISVETFNKAQNIIAGYQKKHFKFVGLPVFPYRGLIRCADCGCMLTPERKIKKTGQTYHYYHCTQYYRKHPLKWLTEQQLDNQFSSLFNQIKIPEEIVDQIVDKLNTSKLDLKKSNISMEKLYKQQQEKLRNRIKVMYDDKLDGSITVDEYEERRNDYKQQLQNLEQKLSALATSDDEYFITSEYILKLASKASELFKSSEVSEKKLIIKSTLQNLEMDQGILRYSWLKPFDKIAYFTERTDWLPRLDSNQ